MSNFIPFRYVTWDKAVDVKNYRQSSNAFTKDANPISLLYVG